MSEIDKYIHHTLKENLRAAKASKDELEIEIALSALIRFAELLQLELDR